jgi:hypothetical protein
MTREPSTLSNHGISSRHEGYPMEVEDDVLSVFEPSGESEDLLENAETVEET